MTKTRWFLSLLILLGVCSTGQATDRTVKMPDGTININEVLVSSSNFDFSMDRDEIDRLSFQLVYSSANPSHIWVYGTAMKSSGIMTSTNNFVQGYPLLLGLSSSTMPSELTENATYYASRVTATSFCLSTNSIDAFADHCVPFTPADAVQVKLTPIPSSGTYSFAFYKSDDGTNWYSLFNSSHGAVSSIVVENPFTTNSVFWDLGDITFKWFRMYFGSGTFGGMNVKLYLYGKRFRVKN